ncbi:MAG: hypothetical protein ACD_26C00167G0008 [uncultured bacterium]|nr:MAG: hypothetical protein ACD_26C00167G0008 [uncultured bacterium]
MIKNNITVAIITYDRSDDIHRCILAILNQTIIPEQIIIVDSSPNNKTKKVIEKINNGIIKYLKSKKRLFIPQARNLALKNCLTKYIAYPDDDTVPSKDWIKYLLEGFSYFDVAGSSGPSINSDENLKPLLKEIHDTNNKNFYTFWGEVRTDSRRWVPPKPVFCTVMHGSNMAYSTTVLKEVGGFDEKCLGPSFREDSHPQVAIIRKGYRFLYHPKAKVYHLVGKKGGISDIEFKMDEYFCEAGKNHRHFSDKYFNKFIARLSWIFWSKNPPCLWMALIRTIIEKKNYLAWHKGLWLN